MIQHLYIECTHTASSGLNTGIQRVVRKVIDQLGEHLPNGAAVSLVTIADGEFYHLEQFVDLRAVVEEEVVDDEIEDVAEIISEEIPEDIDGDALNSPVQPGLKRRFLDSLRAVREAILAKISWGPLHQFLSASRYEFGLSGIIYTLTLRIFLGPKPLETAVLEVPEETKPGPRPLEFAPGDVILLLDSSWHLPAWGAIAKAKQSQAVIFAVIYDLIPITHPQFCEQALCEVFNNWFQQGCATVDGYIAISKTVRHTLRDYLADMGSPLASERFGYFYLGADVTQGEEGAREELVQSISKGDSYLIVSTIEPRKNHQYLMDAFSELWRRGCRVKLHIVGRIGWKVEELLMRIEEHPEFNKQLFLWHDLDDSELVYCYKNSKSLVFSSFVEGFGLPIIEAQHHQLPVLASDTPIHREIGGESIDYFDLNLPADLVAKIIAIEAGQGQLKDTGLFDLEQFTWQKSSEMLVDEMFRIKALL